MASSFTVLKITFRLLIVLLLLGGVAGGGFLWLKYRPVHAHGGANSPSPTLPHIDWDPRAPDELRLPADYKTALKVKTTTVQPAPPPEPLRLRGSLMFDANRLARVKTFFPGQVISIGKADVSKRRRLRYAIPASLLDKNNTDSSDTLRYGDFVHKGQVLCIIWSQTVGEKKSELVNAISQLETDQRVYKRFTDADRGIIKEVDLDNARRAVEQDIIAVEKAERTLRSWQMSDEEVQSVHREAERIRERKEKDLATIRRQGDQPLPMRRPDDDAAHWAETAVRSPIDGIIVEKNFNIGDVIDNTNVLYNILDLTQLQVMANAYEEELAALRRLKPDQMQWKIHLEGAGSGKPIVGEIDQIGRIIDPTQHTGLVTGWLPNRDDDRLIGEFVTATVDLPADKTLVAVPASATIEEGDSASVLVGVDSSHLNFAPRKVAVVQRGRELVLIRAEPNETEKRRGAQPLHVGDEVITTGNLQLAAELANFKASPAGRQ
jgi:cobalt-zinc-cadmium efflux system membrane fusion protein